jgi:hypothetical protein
MSSVRRIALALLLALAAWLPAAAQNGLLIVPGHSIGPIELGMSAEQLRSVFGAPEVPPGPIGPDTNPDVAVPENKAAGHVYQYFRRKVTVLERGGKITNVITLEPGYRTANGIAVGSTVSDVQNAFGAGVRKEGQYGPDISFPDQGIRFMFQGQQVFAIEVRYPSKK